MDIAVIGMSVKMPDADDLDQFWEILYKGICCLKDIPSRRNRLLETYYRQIGTQCPLFQKASYLDDIDLFDNGFFKITPKDAELMDPNQRIFLETAFDCFTDAGYTKKRLYGSKTGVFLGYCNTSQYLDIVSALQPDFLPMAMIPNCTSVIAGRLSYLFNLHGPNETVNTACSSSLVAVHNACRALQNKECDMAVAGGIQLHVLPVRKATIGVESVDGYTRAFDDKATGTGCGEGCGVILLKPLDQAKKDHDAVYAVIKGSAVNHDGLSVGLSAPNPLSQADVITDALRYANINPATVSYIEAHGTGTALGDPIEIEGITKAFRRFTNKKQYCAVSSVKTNIGHLDGAAGIAGLIKAVLSLKKQYLVPSLFFEHPNCHINFKDSPVYICNCLQPWETHAFPRRCGVSSFGLSGTNCHVILEEAAHQTLMERRGHSHKLNAKETHLFTASAETPDALRSLIEKYFKYLCNHPEINIGDLCYTLISGRDHYQYRVAYIVQSIQEVVTILQSVLQLDITKVIQSLKSSMLTPSDNIECALFNYLCGNEQGLYDLYSRADYYTVHLPAYPWNKQSFWITPSAPCLSGSAANDMLPADLEEMEKLTSRSLTEKIKSLFQNILGIDSVDDQDDFFDLGGDSISAVMLINSIYNSEKILLNLEDVVQYGSVAELAAFITNLREGEKV